MAKNKLGQPFQFPKNEDEEYITLVDEEETTADFDIDSLDVSDPKQVHEFKSHIVRRAYHAATDGDVKKTNAFKSLMEVLVESEKRYNLVRQEKLIELEGLINEIEIASDKIAGENAELRAKLSAYKIDD